MKNIIKMIIVGFMSLGLIACGESCEHTKTTTAYTEGDWLDIKKVVTCDECGEEIEEISLASVEYVYNKEIINSNGIKVTIDKLVIDGWSMSELEITIEGTSESKRTFEVSGIYVNGTDSNGWIYVNDLSDNRKSTETHYIYEEVNTADFFKSQDYKVEIDYSILNSSSYKTLKEDTVSFNLNEYSSINEIEAK